MATALTPLANLTLGASQATVTFSSISGSYRDLLLVVTAKSSASGWEARMQLNGDTAANYQTVYFTNSGASPFTSTLTGQSRMSFGALGILSTTNITQWTAHLLDYSATDKHKTVIANIGNRTDSLLETSANRWANTAAVTQVVVYPGSGTWSSGATFALYGVSA